jgi:malate synthase
MRDLEAEVSTGSSYARIPWSWEAHLLPRHLQIPGASNITIAQNQAAEVLGGVMSNRIQLEQGVEINTFAFEYKARDFLNPEVVEALARIQRKLGPQRTQLLVERNLRQRQYDAGACPSYVTDHPASTTSWQVAPIPADLMERRVEITGPVNSKKMVIQMLSRSTEGARADMAMLDFEDSMQPCWSNVMDGVENAIGAARGNLAFIQPAAGGVSEKTYKLDPADMAHPMVRVRGLHLAESNFLVDGEKISASIFDAVVCAAHTAKVYLDRGMTPKFYVPKTEHYQEARWWHKLFTEIESVFSLPVNCLRTTLLIETLPAAFQMEEILYEIRERAVGLNGGRWDKIFSDIKVLKLHGDRVLANRSFIDMRQPWMSNYAQRLIKVCHSHGAFAMGGMSAFTPGKSPEVRKAQTEKVKSDKHWEAEIGHDGCWVSHPYFIGIARGEFAQKNQLVRKLEEFPLQPDLLPLSIGPKTIEGLRTNLRVGMAYQRGWNQGVGCVAFDNLMEDLATLEISRAQVWQWLRHGVILDDGQKVDRGLVCKVAAEEFTKILAETYAELGAQDSSAMGDEERQLQTAKDQVISLFLADELRDFFRLESGELDCAIAK